MIATGPVAADGTFSATIPVAGANVHVLRPGDGGQRAEAVLSTVLGVLPGEQLLFGLPAGTRPSGVVTGQMTAQFTPLPNVTQYEIYTPCGSAFSSGNPATALLSFRENCALDRFPVFAQTLGATYAVSYGPEFLYAPGTTFALPTFRSGQKLKVNVANVPAALAELEINHSTVLGTRAVARQTTYFNGAQAPQLEALLQYPGIPALGSDLQAVIYRNDTGSRQRLTVRTPTSTSSQALDLNALPLPILGAPATSAEGFTWTAVEALAPGDALVTVVQAQWIRPDGSLERMAWRVVGPWAETGRPHPRLPAELAAIDPRVHQADPGFQLGGALASVDIDLADAVSFRAVADQLLDSNDAVSRRFEGMPYVMRTVETSIPQPLSR